MGLFSKKDSAPSRKPNGKPRPSVTSEAQAAELIMMGLRVSDGVDLTEYKKLSGQNLSKASVSELSDLKLIEIIDDRIKTTASGRLVLNWVLKRLLVN